MRPSNVLFICSDEHAPGALGCAGHRHVQTPQLDRLAARGTRFSQAYTNSPICVPARASLATGRYVHQTGCWSSAEPYDGSIPSWGHRLMAAGHRCVSIGKLHYRSTTDANGFDEEILPLHVVDGVGWIRGLLRRDPPGFPSAWELAAQIGPGETSYTDYDRRVAAAACDWLGREAPRHRDKPWVLFVSFVAPHYPLIAPPAFYRLYDPAAVELPPGRGAAPPRHGMLRALREFWNYDDYFDDQTARVATAAYYGLCSYLDHNIGQVLDALETAGLAETTRVLYISDHGEMLGRHGFWAKSVMYQDSVGIPMILSGPDVPAAQTVGAPVSLVDCYPTLVEAAGQAPSPEDGALPGHSLLRVAQGEAPERPVLSEYHDGGAITGIFMLRLGRWKYIHYAEGHPAQLFDLEDDPEEREDLGESPDHGKVRARCAAALGKLLDPEAVNARAFHDQARKIETLGGREALLAREDFNYTPLG